MELACQKKTTTYMFCIVHCGYVHNFHMHANCDVSGTFVDQNDILKNTIVSTEYLFLTRQPSGDVTEP